MVEISEAEQRDLLLQMTECAVFTETAPIGGLAHESFPIAQHAWAKMSRAESVLHETAHLVVLGEPYKRTHSIAITTALLKHKDKRTQEVKTLAAEVILLRVFKFCGVDEWLKDIAKSQFRECYSRVLHRLSQPKKLQEAESHAEEVLRRVRLYVKEPWWRSDG